MTKPAAKKKTEHGKYYSTKESKKRKTTASKATEESTEPAEGTEDISGSAEKTNDETIEDKPTESMANYTYRTMLMGNMIVAYLNYLGWAIKEINVPNKYGNREVRLLVLDDSKKKGG